VITSPRNTAKTPTLFGIRPEKIITIFKTVGAGGGEKDGDWVVVLKIRLSCH
jgi:hypothetical protein